jgi:hypothetical protein
MPFASVIHKDAAHHPRSQSEEMRAALPAHLPVINQTEIGLIDKGRGLKRVTAPLVQHVMARQLAEFVVDEWYQFVSRRFIPVAPVGKQRTHFVNTRAHHATPAS